MKKLLPVQLSLFILAFLFSNTVYSQAPPNPGNDPLAETDSVVVVVSMPAPGAHLQKAMTVSAPVEIPEPGSVSIGYCLTDYKWEDKKERSF